VTTLGRIVSLALLALVPAPGHAAERIVVGSKNFAESRLLAEMFAQVIETHAGVDVERRFNLAGTQVCFEALRTGAIDLYPEYSGTGLVTILGESPGGGVVETLNRVRAEFRRRFDLRWLAPLGFENAYELAVPRELAERHGLRTITDLTRVSETLKAGVGYEFSERDDGLPGLRATYGLEFGEIVTLQQALKYRAVAEREVDCLDVYTTDGRLLVHDLVVLEDDRGFFPPYQAAPLVRGETLERIPAIATALGRLAGAFDEDAMRGLNLRVQERGEPVARVAADGLAAAGATARGSGAPVAGSEAGEGRSSGDGLAAYLWSHRRELGRRTLEHLGLTGLAVGLGILVAVPLGLWLERRRTVAEPLIRVVGMSQTIPSIALLAFMIPAFGIGTLPAVIALWIYSIFPILRNTYSGVRDAAPAAVEAGTALGMTGGQVLRQVRLPLAAPVIMAGVRTAAVITVGTATLAAFIGAGGLGVPIVAGLQLVDSTRILAGALPAAALALLVDAGLGLVERSLRPRGT
jgi:osmoprotectant transport system permease protein